MPVINKADNISSYTISSASVSLLP